MGGINLKDMDDVIRVALANRVDVHSESFRVSSRSMATKESMNESSEPVAE